MSTTRSPSSPPAPRASRAFTASRSRSTSSTSRETSSSFSPPSTSIPAPHAKLLSIARCLAWLHPGRAARADPARSVRGQDPRHLRPASSRSRRRAQAQAGCVPRGGVRRSALPARAASARLHSDLEVSGGGARLFVRAARGRGVCQHPPASSPRWRLPNSQRSFRRKPSVAARSPRERIRSSCASASSPPSAPCATTKSPAWSQQIVKAVESLGGSLRQ